jgi:hypothetical protein
MLKLRLLPHIYFSYLFLILAAFFGLLYALQLVGLGLDLMRPDLVRSLHISLMLYGFPTLMMTILPFALFDKEGVMHLDAWHYLERFLFLWYIFLIFMIFSLLSGITRGLPFYDFPYELNFILALAGIFYIIAIFKSIKHYEVKPLWVKVSLILVTVSPLGLILLMNPHYGQVEQMLLGPHGDNTLGMSFALVAIYYLVIKLSSTQIHFQTRWHILWQIPLGFYILSVLYRSFIGSLSYNTEWFLQYLTLLYIPLLYRWWKDAGLKINTSYALFISILAFLFADIQGNILFVPHIRELFHRNDLVVGHAHIAVGITLPFLTFAVIKPFFSFTKQRLLFLTLMLIFMALILSISGIEQAGFMHMHTNSWWYFRAIFGFLFFAGLLYFHQFIRTQISLLKNKRKIDLYHLVGFFSDGLGGLILILFGSTLYSIIGEPYTAGYQQIVFGFVSSIGIIHFIGYIKPEYATISAYTTSIARVITAAGFFALYKSGILGYIALAISTIDLVFVLIYLIIIKKEEK